MALTWSRYHLDTPRRSVLLHLLYRTVQLLNLFQVLSPLQIQLLNHVFVFLDLLLILILRH